MTSFLNAHLRSPFNFPSETNIEVKSWRKKGHMFPPTPKKDLEWQVYKFN